MLARLKEQQIEPRVYVEQRTMWERELTPLQEQILLDCDAIGRKPRAIRELFQDYARAVSTSLKAQFYDALKHFAQGFLDYPANRQQPTPETLAAIYEHSLIVLYRLLFI